MSTALRSAPAGHRAAMTTVFALTAALAVCVVMLFWVPLEAPASWRAAEQSSSNSELFRM